MTEFLVPAIQKHWGEGTEQKEVKQSAPAPKKEASPLPVGDL